MSVESIVNFLNLGDTEITQYQDIVPLHGYNPDLRIGQDRSSLLGVCGGGFIKTDLRDWFTL